MCLFPLNLTSQRCSLTACFIQKALPCPAVGVRCCANRVVRVNWRVLTHASWATSRRLRTDSQKLMKASWIPRELICAPLQCYRSLSTIPPRLPETIHAFFFTLGSTASTSSKVVSSGKRCTHQICKAERFLNASLSMVCCVPDCTTVQSACCCRL